MDRLVVKRMFQVTTGVLLGLAAVLWLQTPQGDGGAEEADSHFLPSPLPAPDVRLLSHQGDTVDVSQLAATVKAVFFGFTSCPDICPLTLSHLTRVMGRLGPWSDQVQVVFVTVDPERDTPERMAAYLGAFHPSFLGLTGPEERIREVASAFGVYFERVGDGPDYTVDHSARTFIIDADGTIPLTFPLNAAPERMADDIAHLLRTRSHDGPAEPRESS